jgi:hypothetical protein
MTATFYRLLLVSLLAMTFVSQSFAGLALPCQEMSEMSGSTKMTSEAHHRMMMEMDNKITTHDMSSMAVNMDCCDQECKCPVTGFTSYAASETSPTNIIKVTNNKVFLAGFSVLNLSLSLPIKPPAIA